MSRKLLFSTQSLPGESPAGFLNEETAVQYAIHRIAVSYGERHNDLRVTEVVLDGQLSAVVSLTGPTGRRYECAISQTKGGLSMTRVKKTYVN